MQKSEQINELATALSKAQGEIKGALKDSSNPFFKSKYADLASVWDAFREPFSKNGLSLVQLPVTKDNMVIVESALLHSSGQWISHELSAAPKDMTPQSVGSTITYLRRYGAQSIAGVCPEDDDGNAGSGEESIQAPKITVSDEIKNDVHNKTLTYLEAKDADKMRELWKKFDADQHSVLWHMFNSAQRSAITSLIKGK